MSQGSQNTLAPTTRPEGWFPTLVRVLVIFRVYHILALEYELSEA